MRWAVCLFNYFSPLGSHIHIDRWCFEFWFFFLKEFFFTLFCGLTLCSYLKKNSRWLFVVVIEAMMETHAQTRLLTSVVVAVWKKILVAGTQNCGFITKAFHWAETSTIITHDSTTGIISIDQVCKCIRFANWVMIRDEPRYPSEKTNGPRAHHDGWMNF